MRGKKAKVLRRVLTDTNVYNKAWYEGYVNSCVAGGREPFGLKRIKKMAKNKTLKYLRSGDFLREVQTATWR